MSGPAQLWQTLVGRPDSVIGYIVTALDNADPEVIMISGRSRHPIRPDTGSPRHRASGMVFELTAAELSQADAYEVAEYQRVEAFLVSGGKAWVDVEGRPQA